MITIVVYALGCIGLLIHNSGIAAETPDGSTLSLALITKAEDVRERALDWLTNKRSADFGWGEDTAKVIVAIASSSPNWPQKSDLDARLSAKQLEVELLATLLRHEAEPITPTRTAYYFLALTATCKDPYDFHGHNLIESLVKLQKDQDYSGFTDTFGYGLASLVTCLGETHVRKRQTRHLFQLLHKYESIETRAIASLTLECIHHTRNSETLKRHLHDGLETLAKMQRSDGSFGDTQATALAIQSLAAIEESQNLWNKTSALLALMSMQSTSGSFSEDIDTTTKAILGISAMLDGIGLLRFKRHRCEGYADMALEATESYQVSLSPKIDYMASTPNTITSVFLNVTDYGKPSLLPTITSPNETEHLISKSTPATTTTAEELFSTFVSSNTPTPEAKISVKYWLWVGPQPTTAEKYNITIQVPLNSTFYRVMQKAAETAPVYEFSSAIWPNGHYVHTISGHREQPSGYNYWLLYCLDVDPDPVKPPGPEFVAPAGVDELLVHDGEVYLFWYKKI